MPIRFPLAMLLAFAAGCAGGDPYALQTPPATLASGAAGQAEVRFVPGAGFKWNVEFPARLKVVDPGTVQLSRNTFTQADGDFTSSEGVGVLRIGMTAGPAGATALRATADFSVCNADECRIFRAVPIEVPIQVQ